MIDTVLDALAGFWENNRGEIFSTLGVVVGALIIAWMFKRWMNRWNRRVVERMAGSDIHDERERAQRLSTLAGVATVIVMLVVWSVVVLTIMAIWGVPMAPLLAVGTTVGLAVGFGAQDVVRDVIAGFLILAEDQYSVGDVVSIAGVSGSVETVKLRTTVLRDLDGNVHHVPNGQIRVASNMTSAFARYVADIAVSYDSDIDVAMEVISGTAREMSIEPRWKDAFLKEPEMLGVDELGDTAVTIRILLTVASEERWAVKREFLKRVKASLDTAGIEIPYPYVNIVMKDN